LGGEGLQHQDGASHLAASTIPNCRAYDPAFAYEVAAILDEGMREMVERQRDVFYYVTVMNESYAQPSAPQGDAQVLREGILKGIYPLSSGLKATARVQLLGAGAILGEVLAAQRMLAADWGIEAAVWSVTSFTELQRDGMAAERSARLGEAAGEPYVTTALAASKGPVIAATDYVRAVPELIRAYVPRRYVTLGTDGFGRSDTREALREFFEVDRASIVIAALKALADDEEIEAGRVREALQRYDRQTTQSSATPWER
jgi:pyruvate dehydrogenase E1 component